MVAPLTDHSRLSWWKVLLLTLGVFALGFLTLAAVRFFVAKPPAETHYHADFAVFINGKREAFVGPGYYEEVAACTADAANNDPKTRTHMHDNVSDVVHVHDKRVTWQDFFTNIGWSIGPDYVRSLDTLYVTNDADTVTFILNGKKVDRVDNLVIGDQDKLLVSYGPTGADTAAQYAQIKNDAAKYDAGADPSTCQGLNGSDTNSTSARLKRAFFGN